MFKWLRLASVAALVAVVALMALGTGAAFAQGPAGTNPGLGLHLGGPQNSTVSVVADLLKIDRTALVTELNSGKTIADVLKAKGVSVDTVINKMVENRTALLKAAVADKRITQAQMDAELAAMKTNLVNQINSKFSPRGFGQGAGRGMGAGMGFVDANKDGICDNCGRAPHSGTNNTTSQFFGRGGRWNR